MAIIEARYDSYLITVDIQKEDSPLGCLFAEEKVLTDARLWKMVLWHPRIPDLTTRTDQVHMSSKQLAEQWPNIYPYIEQVDLVFVDGGHTYEECRDDIHGWIPLIKPGGVIIIHDYNKQLIAPNVDGPHPKPWIGVNAAVDEFLIPNYEMISYVDSLIAFRIGDGI